MMAKGNRAPRKTDEQKSVVVSIRLNPERDYDYYCLKRLQEFREAGFPPAEMFRTLIAYYDQIQPEQIAVPGSFQQFDQMFKMLTDIQAKIASGHWMAVSPTSQELEKIEFDPEMQQLIAAYNGGGFTADDDENADIDW